MHSMIRTIVFMSLMAISGFTWRAAAQEINQRDSTPADFERFCELMEGRWVGEVTWVADWPGLGKRGDKSVAFLSYTPTDDGKGMLVKFVGGTGSATGLAAYDAVDKKIRFNFVVSGGYYGNEVISVDGNQLTISGIGSLPNGRKHSPRVVRSFTDDGKSFTDSASGEIEGEPTDTVTQIFRKVSDNSQISDEAAEFKEFGDKLAGRWLREIVYVHDWEGAAGGRGDKAIGYHEFQWINDGQAFREINFDGNNRAESIFAWDPTTKRTNVWDDGNGRHTARPMAESRRERVEAHTVTGWLGKR